MKNPSKVAMSQVAVFSASELPENGRRDGYFNRMFLSLTKERFGYKSGSKPRKL